MLLFVVTFVLFTSGGVGLLDGGLTFLQKLTSTLRFKVEVEVEVMVKVPCACALPSTLPGFLRLPLYVYVKSLYL